MSNGRLEFSDIMQTTAAIVNVQKKSDTLTRVKLE